MRMCLVWHRRAGAYAPPRPHDMGVYGVGGLRDGFRLDTGLRMGIADSWVATTKGGWGGCRVDQDALPAVADRQPRAHSAQPRGHLP